jgi:hypothetical protein
MIVGDDHPYGYCGAGGHDDDPTGERAQPRLRLVPRGGCFRLGWLLHGLKLLGWRQGHMTIPDSTPAQDRLWACCDIAAGYASIRASRAVDPGARQPGERK